MTEEYPLTNHVLFRTIALVTLLVTWLYVLDFYKVRPFGWWSLSVTSMKYTVACNSRLQVRALSKNEFVVDNHYLLVVSEGTGHALFAGFWLGLAAMVFYWDVYFLPLKNTLSGCI